MIKVVNDVFMSPTYTFDLAKSIWELGRRQYPYGVYHITNSGYCSWYEFAKYIAQYAGFAESKIHPVPSMEFSAKAKKPKWSVLGMKKFPVLRLWQETLQDFLYQIKKETAIISSVFLSINLKMDNQESKMSYE